MFFNQTDYSILHFLNTHHIPGSVPVMQFISGFTTWVNIASILLVGIFAWRYRSGEFLKKFIILVTVLIISALIIYLLKSFFDRERPFNTYPAIEKLSTGGESSFPSGHTTETFALATAFAFLFRKKRINVLCFGWAILVAYTRMALGVHYPSDVLAGVVFGMVIGFGLPFFGNKLFYSDSKKADNQS